MKTLKTRSLAVTGIFLMFSVFLAGCRHTGSQSQTNDGMAGSSPENSVPDNSTPTVSSETDTDIERELQELEQILNEAETETVDSDSLSPSSLGL